ncbi:884_t:CDS:1, partial [Funneliformis mosseae]
LSNFGSLLRCYSASVDMIDIMTEYTYQEMFFSGKDSTFLSQDLYIIRFRFSKDIIITL